MMACVCPARTVRSTPVRIGFRLPSGSFTDTCRSRISRTLIICLSFALRGSPSAHSSRSPGVYSIARNQADKHEAVPDLDGKGRYRLGRRRAGGLTGTQVEAGAVQPALHGAAVDLPLGEWYLGVRTHVVHREYLPVLGAHHGDIDTVHVDTGRRARRDLLHRTDLDHACASASRDSMTVISRSCSSGTGTLSSSSAKNPRTTSLRASASGMPRAIR